jgi:NAD(P)-dependent dehydrogenase (short-subunit alcohol dehydrogenase family)
MPSLHLFDSQQSPNAGVPSGMKHLLITGASRGIGRETARQLAAAGHHVTAIARTEAPLLSLHAEFPHHITALPVDLAKPKSLEKLARTLEKPLDGMIHNAGKLINKPFAQLTDDDWNDLWDVNVLGIVRLTRALLPFLSKNAHLVLISSMGGFQGASKYPGLSAYATTKGAVSTLAECLAVELASHHVKSNALCLGAVQTEMLAEAFPGYQAPVKPEQMARIIADFALHGHEVFNGKIIPVALSNP